MTLRGDIAADGIRPLKRSEYDALVRAGAFADERVELLYGVIVPMAPQDPEHSEPVTVLQELLMASIGPRARVRVQAPFAAGEESEPGPDIALVPRREYRHEHPDEAWLVVEVANTSQKRDRAKAEIYASAQVPEYWLVDVPRGVIEVYTSPADGRYTNLRTARSGESVALVAFPEVSIAVSDVLGSPA